MAPPSNERRETTPQDGRHSRAPLALTDASGGTQQELDVDISPELHRRALSADGDALDDDRLVQVDVQPTTDEDALSPHAEAAYTHGPPPTKHEGNREEGTTCLPVILALEEDCNTGLEKEEERVLWGRGVGQGSIRISDSEGSMRREGGWGEIGSERSEELGSSNATRRAPMVMGTPLARRRSLLLQGALTRRREGRREAKGLGEGGKRKGAKKGSLIITHLSDGSHIQFSQCLVIAIHMTTTLEEAKATVSMGKEEDYEEKGMNGR
jgi:hypothetical protein